MPKLLKAIIVLAFLLRVPFLNLYPIGFTPDEASFGYDAYSLFRTGKDQWGNVMPLVLESFGDFKAPLYSYLSIPFVALLGLTKTAVRLPNALLSTGVVYIVYLLFMELQKVSGSKEKKVGYALFATFLLAISPWHVQLSRGAFEANLVSFFIPLGILLFLYGLENSKHLVWSSLVFGLSLFTYHSAKIVTPLLVGFLILVYWNQILKKFSNDVHAKKHIFVSFAILAVFAVFTAVTFIQGAGRRAADISIFNGALEAQAEDRLKAIENGINPAFARVLYNKYVVGAERFTKNYTSYFSFEFLFEKGPREGTYGMMPGIGVLYWFELPLLASFIVYSLTNVRKKHMWIIVFWVLIAPIPASLTQGVGLAANRAATLIPALQIASGFGFFYIMVLITNVFKRKPARIMVYKAGSILVSLFVLFSFASFLLKYILFSPSLLAKPMLYGNLEMATWITDTANERNNTISTSLSEPHIYIAFAGAWEPSEYQKSTADWARYRDEKRTFLDQLSQYTLGNFTFKRIEKEDYTNTQIHYLVGRESDFANELKPARLFKYMNGETAIVVITPEGNTYAKAF